MNHLIYAKVCLVLTIGLAGLNIHQLLSSYNYVRGKINEFNEILKDEKSQASLNIVSLIFYFIIPGIYLVVLTKANFIMTGVILLFAKFFISAVLGLWTQKRIFSEIGYTKNIHLIGKFDNLLNIFTFVAVVYLLIFPV